MIFYYTEAAKKGGGIPPLLIVQHISDMFRGLGIIYIWECLCRV